MEIWICMGAGNNTHTHTHKHTHTYLPCQSSTDCMMPFMVLEATSMAMRLLTSFAVASDGYADTNSRTLVANVANKADTSYESGPDLAVDVDRIPSSCTTMNHRAYSCASRRSSESSISANTASLGSGGNRSKQVLPLSFLVV